MLIKIGGLGARGYVRDSMNIFDGIIVIIAGVEIMFQNMS